MPLFRRPWWTSRLTWQRCVGTSAQATLQKVGLHATLRDMQSVPVDEPVTILGWVKSVRRHKSVAFLAVNDGSVEQDVQLVIMDPNLLKNLHVGVSIKATGSVRESPGWRQPREVAITSLRVLGDCPPETYPIQNQHLTDEYLRSLPHLRPKTERLARILKLRSALNWALRRFLHEQQFTEVQVPCIGFADCEGGGESFQVAGGEDFFGRPTFLSVSGQMHLETAACSLGRAYCFGPVFRAEKHNTIRHLSEFPMLEVEIPFVESVEALMEFTESLLRSILANPLREQCDPARVALMDTPEAWPRITYQAAIEGLLEASRSGKVCFEHPVLPGMSFKLEHERFLARDGPVFVYNYPASIKAFYMRNATQETTPPETEQELATSTAACFDLLLPGVAEIVGGSLREDRLPFLERSIQLFGLDKPNYEWYLDLRRFGSVPHGGFGVGVDRLAQFLTNTDNIRDVVLVPRCRGSSLC